MCYYIISIIDFQLWFADSETKYVQNKGTLIPLLENGGILFLNIKNDKIKSMEFF